LYLTGHGRSGAALEAWMLRAHRFGPRVGHGCLGRGFEATGRLDLPVCGRFGGRGRRRMRRRTVRRCRAGPVWERAPSRGAGVVSHATAPVLPRYSQALCPERDRVPRGGVRLQSAARGGRAKDRPSARAAAGNRGACRSGPVQSATGVPARMRR